MEHLTTADEVVKLGRPIGGKVDREKILAYIVEAEQMNIKPVLGDKLFLDILAHGEEKEEYQTLLNGGTYTSRDGGVYSFVGLKCCLAYFVFAKNVMMGDFQTTRFGVVLKEADFSSHISTKERSDCYNDTLEVANSYLRDCLRYCSHIGIPTGNIGSQRASGGIKIRKIG